MVISPEYQLRPAASAPKKPQFPGSYTVISGLRYYNPSSGRWINRDPIAEKGGVNLFAMVGNDPMSRFDPFGLAEGKMSITFTSRTSYDSEVSVSYSQGAKPASCCTKVKMVQIIKGDKPTGYDNNWAVDRGGPGTKAEIKGDGGKMPSYPYYPYDSPSNPGQSSLTDKPGASNGLGIMLGDNILQDFETCAVCAKTGKILGCRKWGHFLSRKSRNDYGDTGGGFVPADAPSANFTNLVPDGNSP